jgi:hypothetical protein
MIILTVGADFLILKCKLNKCVARGKADIPKLKNLTTEPPLEFSKMTHPCLVTALCTSLHLLEDSTVYFITDHRFGNAANAILGKSRDP